MGVVDVADFESGSVSGQTAGAQGGQSSLVGQLGQRIRLVHELRQLGRTEELLDGSRHGTDVHQGLGRRRFDVLDGHSFLDDSLHSGEADAELVLQQFADGAQSSVAQVVDVVGRADAVGQSEQVGDGRDDVVEDDVLRRQFVSAAVQIVGHGLGGFGLLESAGGLMIGLVVFEAGQQRRIEHSLRQLVFGRVEVHVAGQLDEVVADDLDGLAFDGLAFHPHELGTCVLDDLGFGSGQSLALFEDDLARHGVDDVLCEHAVCDTVAQTQLLVVFVTADLGQIVSLRVEEQSFDQVVGAVERGRLARSELSVDLLETFIEVVSRIFGDRLHESVVLAEDGVDLFVRAFLQACGDGRAEFSVAADLLVQVFLGNAGVLASFGFHLGFYGIVRQSAEEFRDGLLSGAVHAHGNDLVGIGFVFQPGPSVGNDRGGEQLVVGLIYGHFVVRSGRTDQLRDHDALCAVVDERALLRHYGEIAHKDFLLLDLTGFLVDEAYLHL